jgi:Uma2 family endonuclease
VIGLRWENLMTLTEVREVAMTAEPLHVRYHEDDDGTFARAFLETMDVPDGHRAEIIGGRLVMSPTAAKLHNSIAMHIAMQVNSDDRYWAYMAQEVDLSLDHLYVPDVVVVPVEVDESDDDPARLDGADVLMAVEVTSPSNASEDREGAERGKWAGYAQAAIPVYLLIDRDPRVAAVFVYSEPVDGRYTVHGRYPLGAKVPLPVLDITLDTTGFRPWQPKNGPSASTTPARGTRQAEAATAVRT